MRNLKYILIFTFVVSLLVSCESDLSIDNENSNKMVIHGILSLDKPFCVKVTKTRNILDYTDKVKVLTSASVLLYDSRDNLYQLLYNEDEGVYKSHMYPKAGEKYTIKVVHKDFPDVTSSTCMPNLSSASVNADFEIDDGDVGDNGNDIGEPDIAVLDLIIDREAVGNYYIWELFYHDEILDKSVKASISSIDENTDNIIPDRDVDQEKIFLKDKRSIDKSLKSRFTTKEISFENVSTASIRLRAVSEHTYEYYKSLEIYRKTAKSNNFNNVEVHSNVKGGLGIFGAVNETTVIINK